MSSWVVGTARIVRGAALPSAFTFVRLCVLENLGDLPQMKMLVLGAGLQGSACAYDLLQNKDVEEVRLADIRIHDIPHFLAGYSGKRLIPTPVDVRDTDAVLGLMRDS